MQKFKVILTSIGFMFISAVTALTSTFAWFTATTGLNKVNSNLTMSVQAPPSNLEITDGVQAWSRDTVTVSNGNRKIAPVAHKQDVTAYPLDIAENWYYYYSNNTNDGTASGSEITLSESSFENYVFKQRFYFRSGVGVSAGLMCDEIIIPTYINDDDEETSTGITVAFLGANGNTVEYNETHDVGWTKRVKLTDAIADCADDNLTPENQWIDAYIYIDGTQVNVKTVNITKLAGEVKFGFSEYIDKVTINLQLKYGKLNDASSQESSFGGKNCTGVPYVYFYNSAVTPGRTKEYEYAEAPGVAMNKTSTGTYVLDQGSGERVALFTYDLLIAHYTDIIIYVVDGTTTRRSASIKIPANKDLAYYNQKYICLDSYPTSNQYKFSKWINPITFKLSTESTDNYWYVFQTDNAYLTYDLMPAMPTTAPSGYSGTFKGWAVEGTSTIVNPMIQKRIAATTYIAQWDNGTNNYTIYLQAKIDSFGKDMQTTEVDKVVPFVRMWNTSAAYTKFNAVHPGMKMDQVTSINGVTLPTGGVIYDPGCSQYVTVWKYRYESYFGYNQLNFTKSRINHENAAVPENLVQTTDSSTFSNQVDKMYYISDSVDSSNKYSIDGRTDAYKYRIQFFSDSSKTTRLDAAEYIFTPATLQASYFPSAPTPAYQHVFAGWTTDGTTIYKAGDTISGNIQLYPKYIEKTHYLIYTNGSYAEKTMTWNDTDKQFEYKGLSLSKGATFKVKSSDTGNPWPCSTYSHIWSNAVSTSSSGDYIVQMTANAYSIYYKPADGKVYVSAKKDVMYFKPNGDTWTKDSAVFAVEFYSSASYSSKISTVNLSSADSDGYYKYTVPSNATYCKYLRQKSDRSETWNYSGFCQLTNIDMNNAFFQWSDQAWNNGWTYSSTNVGGWSIK